MLAGVLASLVLMASPLQDAQTRPVSPPQESAATPVDDVVVQGRSIEQQARAYVAEVTKAPGNRRLATWDRRVCVGVLGLDAAYAQFLVDRISAVAASVGLDPGDPGCRPDVFIAFSRDPDAVAQAWVDQDLDAFRPTRSGQTDLGAEALEQFRVSDAPVRWWHVSLSVNAQTGISVTQLRGDEGPTYQYLSTPSLIQSPTVEALNRVFIVVDADQIGGATFGSLSDYLALVALTQVDPQAETGTVETVLNLFDDQPAARLSVWDFEYLHSLYRSRTNPIRAATQTRQIARELSERQSRSTTMALEEAGDRDVPPALPPQIRYE